MRGSTKSTRTKQIESAKPALYPLERASLPTNKMNMTRGPPQRAGRSVAIGIRVAVGIGVGVNLGVCEAVTIAVSLGVAGLMSGLTPQAITLSRSMMQQNRKPVRRKR